MNTNILRLLLIFVLYTTANGENAMRLCGKVLNEVLTVVCDGKLNPLPLKRNDPSLKVMDKFQLSDLIIEDMENMLKTRRRRYDFVGIHDECCRNKGCTVSELKSYCLE